MIKLSVTANNATAGTLYCGSSHNVYQLVVEPTSIEPGGTASLSEGIMPSTGLPPTYFLTLYADSAKSGTPFKLDVTFDVTGQPSVAVSAPDGFVLGYHLEQDDDGSMSITVTAYPGLAVHGSTRGYAIDLTDQPMTYAATRPYVFADLINSMFDPNVRSAAVIAAAGASITDRWGPNEAPPVFSADFTGGQFKQILTMFTDYWLHGKKDACPAPDQVLIDLLKAFVKDQKQRLWVPLLNINEVGPPQIFNLTGYVGFDFTTDKVNDDNQGWDENTVDRFLTLLISGAHVVQICAQQDMATIGKTYSAAGDFFAYFANAQIVRGNDLGSSHYVATGVEWNNAGWYFLDINGETMPAKVTVQTGGDAVDAGLLDAFMVGATVNNWDGSVTAGQYNTFFQSEGWQQQGLTGGDRHMDDKSASDQTAWNIGTLGASPYSEKRGTSVFLAPDGWTPQVTTVTDMMPYVGAYAEKDGKGYKAQPWLKTQLVNAVKAVALDTSLYVVD